MATLRQQIENNLPRFHDLLKQISEARPNDDLEIVRKAYEFSQRYHAGGAVSLLPRIVV